MIVSLLKNDNLRIPFDIFIIFLISTCLVIKLEKELMVLKLKTHLLVNLHNHHCNYRELHNFVLALIPFAT